MKIQSKSPIIVVSNRLPFVLKKDEETGLYERKQSAGGLVTAVAPVVVETKGLWVGWPGIHFEDEEIIIPEAEPNDDSPAAGLKSEQVIPVNINRQQYDEYYNGCCNACLWPLFHSMPDRALFQNDKWESYRLVNQEFAALTVQAVKLSKVIHPHKIPLVWVHDYHLLLAANHIRVLCEKEDLEIKLAFFLHIPFPSWDIMRLFPRDDELLQGILGCDSLGFHIEDYCSNFIDCCQRRLGCRVDRDNMHVEHHIRKVSVNALPISIPYDRFSNLAENAPSVINNREEEQLILGVDRLDYTKGLVKKIKAFENLMEKYPYHIGRATLLQIAVPSRTDVVEYQELKEELDQLIGRVNGRFSTPNWSPIRYIYGFVSQNELAAFYRDASVCLVTPLRDGMNLVAKEFVACQIREDGVLVLSPFAGAGESMHEALLVNPYELNEFAEILHRALTMPKDERELRMKNLRRREKQRDVSFWLRSFLKSVECLADDGSATGRLQPLIELDFGHYLSNHVNKSSRLALLLDYDGTLTPIASHPNLATIPPETKKVLERLAGMPDVNVAIISGRSLSDIQNMVGIKGITYAGNHGFEILHPDGSLFNYSIPDDYLKMLEILKPKLVAITGNGAWLEDKGSVLTFHYREVPIALQSIVKEKASAIFTEMGIIKHECQMAYEVKPPGTWNKGRAAIHILRTLFGVDWCDRVSTIYAGDDVTDEDAMQVLQGIAITFRITDSQYINTAASYRLPNTDSIYSMLKWIERRLGFRSPTPSGQRSRASSFSNRNSPPLSPTNQLGHPGLITNMSLKDEDYQNIIKRNSPPGSPELRIPDLVLS